MYNNSSPGNFQHQYQAELLANVYSHCLMVKSVSCCCVHGSRLFSDLVTYEVLFGCNPSVLQIPNLPGPVVPDPAKYSAALKRKLYVLRELVEANTVHSAERQQFFYNSSTPSPPQLKAGQQVQLNNPSKWKLSPCWTEP